MVQLGLGLWGDFWEKEGMLGFKHTTHILKKLFMELETCSLYTPTGPYFLSNRFKIFHPHSFGIQRFKKINGVMDFIVSSQLSGNAFIVQHWHIYIDRLRGFKCAANLLYALLFTLRKFLYNSYGYLDVNFVIRIILLRCQLQVKRIILIYIEQYIKYIFQIGKLKSVPFPFTKSDTEKPSLKFHISKSLVLAPCLGSSFELTTVCVENALSRQIHSYNYIIMETRIQQSEKRRSHNSESPSVLYRNTSLTSYP